MIRSASNVSVAVMVLATVIFCVTVLPEAGFSTSYPTSVDPFEVIAYEHVNFVGEYKRFKIEPGMRHKLVPYVGGMNDRISSIQVGSKVKVFMFMHKNFNEYMGDYYDSAKILPGSINDSISSLIVSPKECGHFPIGAFLTDHRTFSHRRQFFPLPEPLNETEARYANLPNMNDDANEISFYPFKQAPVCGNVQVTLYEHANFKGGSITLPGGDGSIPDDGFPLSNYKFGDTASSLIVRLTGSAQAPQTQVTQVQVAKPMIQPSVSSSTRVVAPQAPVTAQTSSDRTPPSPSSGMTITNVSGRWKSSIGVVYDITQQGAQFTWTVAIGDETGKGTISGNKISAFWKGQQGSGSSAGQITRESAGKATEIKWGNGIQFYRE